jgi:hypothetical protein
MNKNHIILCLVAVLITFLCILNPAFGEGHDNVFMEEEQIKEIIKNSKSINSDILNELENEKNVLAIYGKIPEIKEEAEYYNWWISISNISDSILDDDAIKNHLYANGNCIIGYGPQSEGYILISIYDSYEEKLESKDIEEIAFIFEKYAKEENISDVPLVFRYAPMNEVYNHKFVLITFISDNVEKFIDSIWQSVMKNGF